MAADFIRSHDCIPTFKGQYGFPRYICISFNEEVVHGIPSERRLKEGDIIKLDIGATYRGWVGDAAMSFAVGQVSPQAQKLLYVTRQANLLAIAQMRPGQHLHDISAAIHHIAEKNGLAVVIGYSGHGIGRKNHEDPHVPNNRQAGRGVQLRKGRCLAIEPMLNLGKAEVKVQADGWTFITTDGKLSAHFEHTAVVTDGKPEILTLP